jgi:hypothetical protein
MCRRPIQYVIYWALGDDQIDHVTADSMILLWVKYSEQHKNVNHL